MLSEREAYEALKRREPTASFVEFERINDNCLKVKYELQEWDIDGDGGFIVETTVCKKNGKLVWGAKG